MTIALAHPYKWFSEKLVAIFRQVFKKKYELKQQADVKFVLK